MNGGKRGFEVNGSTVMSPNGLWDENLIRTGALVVEGGNWALGRVKWGCKGVSNTVTLLFCK